MGVGGGFEREDWLRESEEIHCVKSGVGIRVMEGDMGREGWEAD